MRTAGATDVPLTEIFIPFSQAGINAFSLVPQRLPATPSSPPPSQLGTAYFVSNLAVFNPGGIATQILLWTLSGTASLETSQPQLQLTADVVVTGTYIRPEFRANQKRGYNPLGSSLSLGGFQVEPAGGLSPGDSRVQSLVMAGGKLWGAFGVQQTVCCDPSQEAVDVSGTRVCGPGWAASGCGTQAAVFLFQLDPLRRQVAHAGTIAVPFNHLVTPTLAINDDGKGAVAFTLTGNNFYPTAAYASIDGTDVGPVTVASLGQGVQDGYTQYRFLDGVTGTTTVNYVPRWGDYGAAAVDEEGNLYLGSQYVAFPACSAGEFGDPFGLGPLTRCGGTRTPLTNWATAITKLEVK